MYRREKSVVGEMCSRVNIRSGKCLVGQMSSQCRSANCPVGDVSVGEVSVGEMSSRGSVRIPFATHLILSFLKDA